MSITLTLEDASVTNPVCDSSPDSYARQRRLNSSLMTGGLFGVGSLLYLFATRKNEWHQQHFANQRRNRFCGSFRKLHRVQQLHYGVGSHRIRRTLP